MSVPVISSVTVCSIWRRGFAPMLGVGEKCTAGRRRNLCKSRCMDSKGRCLGCYRSEGARWLSDGTLSTINQPRDDWRTHEGLHRNKFHGSRGWGQRFREHGWIRTLDTSTTAPTNASGRMSPRTVQNRSDRRLRRGSQGMYLRIRSKRPQRFVPELAGHHNIRDLDTIARMVVIYPQVGREAVAASVTDG